MAPNGRSLPVALPLEDVLSSLDFVGLSTLLTDLQAETGQSAVRLRLLPSTDDQPTPDRVQGINRLLLRGRTLERLGPSDSPPEGGFFAFQIFPEQSGDLIGLLDHTAGLGQGR